jgi:origin recognition complex subunit 2
MKKNKVTNREHKFDFNIQRDKENTAVNFLDENSLLALESKGESRSNVVTPGKELFRLTHSHKRKSEAWSVKSLPANKTPQSSKSKAAVKSLANTPCKTSSRTPLKLVKSNSSVPASLNKSKQAQSTASSVSNTRRQSLRSAGKVTQQITEPMVKGNGKAVLDTGITPMTTRRMAKMLNDDVKELSEEEEVEQIETASVRKKRAATRSKTPMVERCQKRIKANKELLKVEASSESSAFGSDSDSNSEKENEEMEIPSYQGFFSNLSGLSKKSTSNNTLSQLPVLDPQEYLKELKKICLKTSDLVLEQKKRLQNYFPDWVFELEYGFNILCYGYGSKKDLLEEFAESNFSGYPILKVNGFFPTLNMKVVLAPMLDLIKHTGKSGTVLDQVNLVVEYFKSPEREIQRLILVVHNIDSVSLRNDKASTLLSLLAECPNIHMIASVDHINASCLWDHNKSQRFNWIWHDATTFAPWITESTFENSVLVKTVTLGPRNVIQVLNSLNSHARGVTIYF